MIKTLNNTLKQDKEQYKVPKKVQDMIPVQVIYPDGIFLSGKNKYSKTFKFEDINYAVASRSDKEMMFLEYSELLNAFDSGATTKITINNRRLNKLDFEDQILINMKDDGLNEYRKEYNDMLKLVFLVADGTIIMMAVIIKMTATVMDPQITIYKTTGSLH